MGPIGRAVMGWIIASVDCASIIKLQPAFGCGHLHANPFPPGQGRNRAQRGFCGAKTEVEIIKVACVACQGAFGAEIIEGRGPQARYVP